MVIVISFDQNDDKTSNKIEFLTIFMQRLHSFNRKNILSCLTRSRHVIRLIVSLVWDILDVNFCIDLLKVDMLHLASSLIHLSPQRLDG